ncbi:hypothetical protein BU14_0076s0030 [Porphyra umbilicalis]|uniref:Uncharacterized protein n=1 Tax=Porphyra umbilicalis TaxID=2786 RepID=A0A1X6PF42_PORUM|nr:hypothetical protein BU14_0076s0030 [Porphyra umbilicalis]|eukprot:OSX79474.1 hypothetical protein BU14_0076s0030 [Porphyra umbilicalis]
MAKSPTAVSISKSAAASEGGRATEPAATAAVASGVASVRSLSSDCCSWRAAPNASHSACVVPASTAASKSSVSRKSRYGSTRTGGVSVSISAQSVTRSTAGGVGDSSAAAAAAAIAAAEAVDPAAAAAAAAAADRAPGPRPTKSMSSLAPPRPPR